ncbi:energy transducer TonB [Dyella sp.]|uniref:energy transducer TonB n=1 Tax=Dyella sp. TaxID=1869338 RepID=UPI002ECFECAE
MKRWAAVLLCVGFIGSTQVVGAVSARKSVEASMMLTGSLELAADGSVSSYALDRQDLQPEIADLIKRNVATWRFKAQDGGTLPGKTSMLLRLVAKPVGDGNFGVSIVGANFGEKDPASSISFKDRQWPKYPDMARHAKAGGIAYLMLRVDRSGHVTDAAVAQVDLTSVSSDSDMRTLRTVLGDAAMRAAQNWTFNLPTQGPHANDASWVVRVPVNFHMRDQGLPDKDGWMAYIPGPRQEIPWLAAYRASIAGAVDTSSEETPSLVGTGPVLTTPLNQG